MSSIAVSRFAARLVLGLSLWVGGTLLRDAATEDWPGPEPALADATHPDDDLIRGQRVCVLNALDTAGEIGRKLAFRARRDGDSLRVSYFVHWSTERPWGDKSPMVSLAIDSVYSHFFFFLPGLRYIMHGPSDIEGATVVYRVEGERLVILEGFADDESHAPVNLDARELTDRDSGTVLMTTVWSHQLGARGAAQASSEVTHRHCYQGADLIPLTATLAERFWLGTAKAPLRALPAWR